MPATERVRQARLAVDLARTASERQPSAWASQRLELALAELERAEIEEIETERPAVAA